MALISELRYPTRWYGKLTAATLALAFFALLATTTIAGFLLYRILSPVQRRAEIDTRIFPGHPGTVTFTVPGAGSRMGWFFPGLKTAPTIILCHGYQSNRGELLTLASALQDNQYNVFLFDFAAHGTSPGFSTLGYRETQEVHAAIAAVAQREDVDRNRFGLWGANLGGYAVLAAASSDPRVRAVAVESTYNQPVEMLRLQVLNSGLGALPLIEGTTTLTFRWLHYMNRNQPPLDQQVARLNDVAKLFVVASDEAALATSTRELFLASPEPREQLILPKGNYAAMLDEEKRRYEKAIVTFFLQHLPSSGRANR